MTEVLRKLYIRIGGILYIGVSENVAIKASFPEIKIVVDSKCCAGVSVESHNTALDAMKAVQIEVI